MADATDQAAAITAAENVIDNGDGTTDIVQTTHRLSSLTVGGSLDVVQDGTSSDDSSDDDDDDTVSLPQTSTAYENEFLSLLPPCVLPRVNKLKQLNDTRDKLLEEYILERAALEMKYTSKMQPLYEERRGIVNGEFECAIANNVEHSKGGGDNIEEDREVNEVVVEDVNEEDAGTVIDPTKGLPQFWLCAMGHMEILAVMIEEEDTDCLDHLTDITSTNFKDGLGFELHFHFSPNAFFTNTILTKRYEVPNLLTEDEPILKNVTGTDIDWKKGKSLTYKELVKKQRRKSGPNAGQMRIITKQERTNSFFHFFTPPNLPHLTEIMDEEEADAIEEAFDNDYDVAQAIRSHLIPKAILWFTGEAMMEDYDEEMMSEMMKDEQEEGEDSGIQQPFTFDVTAGGDNPFPSPPPQPGEGENPECNQS